MRSASDQKLVFAGENLGSDKKEPVANWKTCFERMSSRVLCIGQKIASLEEQVDRNEPSRQARSDRKGR